MNMTTILAEIDALQKEINAHRPFDNEMLKQIKEYFRIGLTYTSNALEGNSLTESETKVVIEEGITIGGKRLVEHYEAVGHSDAFTLMYEGTHQKTLTEDMLKRLHHLFYYRIDEPNAGVYRNFKAHITGSQYPLPLPAEISELMKQFVQRANEFRSRYHPVEFAALMHKEFVFIHPFVDGNGRVSRLMMNMLLMQAGYVITIIPPVVRHRYFQALERAPVDDRDFVRFIAEMVRETQRDYRRLFLASK